MAKIIINVELNSKAAQTDLKGLQTSVETIVNSLQNVRPNKNLTSQINALSRYYNALAKAATSATTATEKRQAAQAKANLIDQKAQTELARRAKILADNSKATKKYTQSTDKATASVDNHKQSIVTMIPQILKWQLAMTAVMKPLQLIKSALSSVNETLVETENTAVAVGRVLDENIGNKQIADKLYEVAQRYGQSFENVSEIAQNFARSGLDWNETIKATEAAVLALNVAELDAEDASDGLISIMVQYGKEAEDLIGIIDELNKVADEYAVSTEKLLKGLQRTGSSAVNANLTLEDTIAILTGLSEATNRSGENLGTAVNSLIQYSSKAKALDIFASLSEDSEKAVTAFRMGAGSILDVWAEVAKVIQNADERQQELLTTLADSEDIQNLSEELHDELGDIFEQTEDVYGTANTFRKNYFISLLENINTIMEARETAQTAEGYSQQENLTYLDTYTAKVEKLQAKWQEVANDEQGLLGMKKDLADFGYLTLEAIDYIGGLRTVLLAAGTASIVLFGPKAIKSLIEFGNNVKNIFTSIKTGAISAQASLGVIGLILAGISLVMTGISTAIGIADEKAERAIQRYKDLSREAQDTADKLLDIADRYEEAGGNVETLNGLQEELNKLIGDQANGIDLVNGKLDDELTKLQDIRRYQYLQGALNDAEQAALKTKYNAGRFEARKYFLPEEAQALRNAGIDLVSESVGSVGAKEYYYDALPQSFDNMGDLLAQYDAIDKYLLELSLNKDYGVVYDTLAEWRETYSEVVKNYRDIEAQINAVDKKTEEAKSQTNQWLDPLSKVKDEYKDIVNAINETIDAQEQAIDLSEKELAIAEAKLEVERARADAIISAMNAEKDARADEAAQRQNALAEALRKQQSAAEGQADALEKQLEYERALKALRDAENDRSVRVYNAETGRFEMRANAEAVESARERLTNAQNATYVDPYAAILAKVQSGENLTESEKNFIAPIVEQVDRELAAEREESARENEAWDYILSRINEGAKPSEIKRDLEEYLADAYGGNAYPEWAKEYADIIDYIFSTFRPDKTEGVQDAMEKVQEATDAFNDALNDQYVKKITSLLSSGETVNLDEIYELVNEWISQLKDTTEIPPELTAILSAIDNTAGTKLNDSITSLTTAIEELSAYIASLSPQSTETPPPPSKRPKTLPRDVQIYDHGGVLEGLGGIKATNRDEIILPPELTERILRPTSNAQFKAFADSLGLMFGAGESVFDPRNSMQSNVITHNNDSRSYVVNGVPISQQAAQQYTVAEIFQAISFKN